LTICPISGISDLIALEKGNMKLLINLALFLFCACPAFAQNPSVLYLTWIHDPTSTMTVQWHTEQTDPESCVRYRKQGESTWLNREGSYNLLTQSDIIVHTVELDQLDPDTVYEFSLKEGSKIYTFRTLPQTLSRSLKFVMGGDAYFYLSKFKLMNARIASLDPDFVVVGGDIAYTVNSRAVFKGKGWELNRWRRFLKEWKEHMVTSDRRMIPIIPVVGNHDIKQSSLIGKHQHYLFYELFALSEKGISYRTMDVGDYLSLFLLDSGHSFHIEGQQTKWLEDSLAERQKLPYKFASYHIAAYPSVYPFDGGVPKRIRYYWSPLFERYHLQAAFEHHNHAYKRTFPIKRGKSDPTGVVYMGDGSWGVSARKPKELWYLEKKAQANAVCLVTLQSEQGKVEAIDVSGSVIDQISFMPMQGDVAWHEGTWCPHH